MIPDFDASLPRWAKRLPWLLVGLLVAAEVATTVLLPKAIPWDPSYGMLAVVLESTGGEKLQIITGNTASLIIPIPSSKVSSAPATISLWYIDEVSGIWKEQGTAKKNGNNYTGDVQHFSYWNADFNLPAISFSAIFKTSDNVL